MKETGSFLNDGRQSITKTIFWTEVHLLWYFKALYMSLFDSNLCFSSLTGNNWVSTFFYIFNYNDTATFVIAWVILKFTDVIRINAGILTRF